MNASWESDWSSKGVEVDIKQMSDRGQHNQAVSSSVRVSEHHWSSNRAENISRPEKRVDFKSKFKSLSTKKLVEDDTVDCAESWVWRVVEEVYSISCMELISLLYYCLKAKSQRERERIFFRILQQDTSNLVCRLKINRVYITLFSSVSPRGYHFLKWRSYCIWVWGLIESKWIFLASRYIYAVNATRTQNKATFLISLLTVVTCVVSHSEI